jgi:hypothetical protein
MYRITNEVRDEQIFAATAGRGPESRSGEAPEPGLPNRLVGLTAR